MNTINEQVQTLGQQFQNVNLQQLNKKGNLQDQVQQNYQGGKQEIRDVCVPYKLLTGHWMTISRPQYKRTCGISSLVSLWNFQFSRLGVGNKQPITIEQAMLKLNLIGNGSVEQNMRNKFKKTAQLTQKLEQNNQQENGQENKSLTEQKSEDVQIRNNKMPLNQYINTIDFGCFTGNDTLLKWYRLLCRIYGVSGRSYLFYKTDSEKSVHKNQETAKKALVQGLSSNGKTCFIYHAYDHYFCPVGYEIIPKEQENPSGTFNLNSLNEQGNQLYVMIGQSSKMFPCMHVVKWSDIQLDLQTYWPNFFNIRRKKEGVQFYKGKQNQQSRGNTIDCIMAFEKLKD